MAAMHFRQSQGKLLTTLIRDAQGRELMDGKLPALLVSILVGLQLISGCADDAAMVSPPVSEEPHRATVPNANYDPSMERAGKQQLRLTYHANGKLHERFYVITVDFGTEEIKTGSYESWHSNGQRQSSGHFVGLEYEDGPWQEWWENGNPRSIRTYRDGIPHGCWQTFDIEGTLQVDRIYDAGQVTSEWVRPTK